MRTRTRNSCPSYTYCTSANLLNKRMSGLYKQTPTQEDPALKSHHVPSFPPSIATQYLVQPQLEPRRASNKPLSTSKAPSTTKNTTAERNFVAWLLQKPHIVTDRVLDGLMFYAWRIIASQTRVLILEVPWVVALTRAACDRAYLVWL